MPKLEIHFNEGFNGNDAEIRVNGAAAARLRNVSTNWSIGLAGTVDLEVPTGNCLVEIALNGEQSAKTELTISEETYLHVRHEQGRLHFQSSNTPPAYF